MSVNKLNIFNNDVITAENTFHYLKDYLNKDDFVLDVGSGTGFVADLLSKNIGCKTNCIDVLDINKTNLPLTLFEGTKIPFKSNAFSVVLCCFVLHHAKDQEKLLKEIRRVSKSKILIFEDIPINFIDKILFMGHDLISRFRYKSERLVFHDVEGWIDIFKNNGLKVEKIIEIDKRRQLWYPVSRRLFVLR